MPCLTICENLLGINAYSILLAMELIYTNLITFSLPITVTLFSSFFLECYFFLSSDILVSNIQAKVFLMATIHF